MVLLIQLSSEAKAYFCNAKGVFPIPKGSMSPAAPSLVVLGEKASAISVTLRDGSLSRMVTAEERPITPAPTTAMEAMLFRNHNFCSGHAVGHAMSRYPYPDLTLFNVDDLGWKLAEKCWLFFFSPREL